VNRSRDKLDRQRAVAKLRLSGVTDQCVIAERLGVHQSTISRDFVDLDRQFREEAGQDTATAKGIDAARLDALIESLWPAAVSGKWLAVDRVLKCLERRASLLGLDAPQKKHITGDIVLRDFAERAALDAGLDPRLVLAEAERILAEAD
jgi:hypothetical protein